MKTIAVTGVASRFAQVLLPLLQADPDIEKIVGIDRAPPKGTFGKLEFRQQDIRDLNIKETLTGSDALIHLAFVVLRPASISLEEAADINLAGTWNVLRAATEAGVRKLVVSSSIAAYGGLRDNPEWLTEESPLRGLYTDFYYSQHKHANEIWMDGLQLAYPDLLITRLRPSIVMGSHQSAASTMIYPGKVYYITPEARETRLQFVHEDDLASAFQLAVQRDLPGAYNVVGNNPDTMPNIAQAAGLQVVEVPYEIIAQSVEASWKAGASEAGTEWLNIEGNTVCSNEKLKAAGWTPRYTTTEAYAATVKAIL